MPDQNALTHGNTQEGYEIELCIYQDGTFAVSGPNPIEETDPNEKPETFHSLKDALLAIVSAVKQNPIGDESGQKSFEAGYASGPRQAASPDMQEGQVGNTSGGSAAY